MPKKLEDCVKKLIDKGYTEQSAYAICTASLNREQQEQENKIQPEQSKKEIGKPKRFS